MTGKKPTFKEWDRIYQAAIRIREISPWDWMEEWDIFGVQNPETGEIGFVSIMGALGEYLAVAVYLGKKGLHGFWSLREMPDAGRAETIMQIPQLHASFEDRDALSKEDHAIIKKLGLKFRGRQSWPLIRSRRPYYLPWYVDENEVLFLTHVLEQTADVAIRFRDDPSILDPVNEQDYLVRVPRKDKEIIQWADQIETISSDDDEGRTVHVDFNVLEKVKRFPRSEHIFEMDCFIFPTPIGEKGAPPFFPFMLLLVDNESGAIVCTELMKPEPGTIQMLDRVPNALIHELEKLGTLPGQIRIQSLALADLLEPLEDELNVRIRAASKLPALEAAKEELFQKFGSFGDIEE